MSKVGFIYLRCKVHICILTDNVLLYLSNSVNNLTSIYLSQYLYILSIYLYFMISLRLTCVEHVIKS